VLASRRWLVYFALGCSGMAALIYETAWTRQLGLLMGHSVAAASTVLAAFMLGLAAGTAVGGRTAGRVAPAAALRIYAVLEILIGVLALLLPAELASLRPVLSWFYGDGAGSVFGIVRLISAVVVVTIPALAMGATLPLVVRWAVGPAMSAARDTARLYGRTPSVRQPERSPVALSCCLHWGPNAPHDRCGNERRRRSHRLEDFTDVTVHESPSHAPIGAGRSRTSGAGSPVPVPVPAGENCGGIRTRNLRRVVADPAKSRGRACSHSSSVRQVCVQRDGRDVHRRHRVWIAGWWLAWTPRSRSSSAGVSMLFSGTAALAAAAWVPQSSLIVANAVSGLDSSFARVMWLQSLLIGAAMLPMTVGFGAAFPLAVGLVVRDERPIASDVAAVYIANTLGAIVGALAGGFLLIPRLGLEGSVRTAALLVMGGAVVVVMAAGTGRRRAAVILVAAAAAS
jgi:spermidine synthase